MSKIPAVVWHLSPIISIYFQRPLIMVAFLLAVFLPYIKVKKLNIMLDEIRRKGGSDDEEAAILRTISLWKRLTFLK